MKSIHLKDSFEDSLILQGYKHFDRSRIIYTLLIILALGLLFVFPWVKIESIVTSPAVVLPFQEPTQIRAKTSGEIHLFGASENRFVFQGDTLFTFRPNGATKSQVMLSPTDGYVRNLRGCEVGFPILEDQVILEIFPEPSPVVKFYLTEDQITSIQPDQKIQFHLQSSHNQTEKFLEGNIMTISQSYVHSNNEKMEVYEVLCSIDTNQEIEKSVKMKTGMTLIARFRLARRSAFDILMKDPSSLEINPS